MSNNIATRGQQPTALLPTQPKESLIAAYRNLRTPNSILSSIRCRNYEDVLTSNHPTLAEMVQRSKGNNAFVLSYVSAAIVSYLDFIGRRQTMDDQQVAETAELILSEYDALKFDDIALFIRLCKLSRYGKLYDINGAVLLQWLQTYIQERNQADYRLYEQRERQRRDEEARRLEEEWQAMSPAEREQCKNKFTELVKNIAKQKSVRKRKECNNRQKITLEVIADNAGLYDSMPQEKADELIMEKINAKLKETK